ncbi:ENV1 protein, partial [Hylia prasina]|nr:ENV1 protein [Hylia prasina]
PTECKWDIQWKKITLEQVTGQGVCIGNTTLAKQYDNLCINIVAADSSKKWAIPSAPEVWLCHQTEITPCVSVDLFAKSNDFCVQVLIVLKVLYHPEEELYRYFEESTTRLQKKEIITGITVAILLGLGTTGAATGVSALVTQCQTTGVSALVTQCQSLSQLQLAIDADLKRIENSVSALEKLLFSLPKVVLQNRQGLDLLFMQQGGLCAALKEECCFYADHTGVVRDSMAELRDRLAQRKRDREAQQGWFRSWFNQLPWFTTLISALIGPLTLLFLTLVFGPCLLKKFVAFVRSHLEKANILLVHRQ